MIHMTKVSTPYSLGSNSITSHKSMPCEINCISWKEATQNYLWLWISLLHTVNGFHFH